MSEYSNIRNTIKCIRFFNAQFIGWQTTLYCAHFPPYSYWKTFDNQCCTQHPSEYQHASSRQVFRRLSRGKQLKKLGGRDLKDTVFTAWHYVMTVELRTKFNWQGNPRAGKETKRVLESTNVKKAIFGRLFLSYLNITCILTYFFFLITGVI